MKRLMIIAGGEWQVPIVRKAKEMGLFVINTNLYQDSPAFAFADMGLVADVLDRNKNLDYGRQWAPDGVLTDQSDIAVTTVAHLAEKLGLPGIGSDKAALFTDKSLMRSFCAEHGYPGPSFCLCHNFPEVERFVDEVGLPCVVKPPASQSSRGVKKVSDKVQLRAAYTAAVEFSHDDSVLVETFIPGIELTVDGIQLNAGRHYCLATSCKSHYAHNEMIANKLVFSGAHPEINYEALHAQHNRLIEDMSLPFGLTHAEYKYHEGVFYLIEVAARGGGTRLSSDIVPLMSGIDSNELLIRMAMGEQISTMSPSFSDKIVALDFLQFAPGIIQQIDGVEEAMSFQGIIALTLNVQPGKTIPSIIDDRSRHGYVIAIADTRAELQVLLDQVRTKIRVTYE